MDLKFAEIRNINQLCNLESKGNNNENVPLNVNIPYYQRPYKWDNTRIGNLITDFYDNEENENEDEGYFAGSVVMVKGESGRFEVIDGQQRITTLFFMNYLRFLLIRGYIELIIKTKKMSKIKTQIDELIDTAVNLFDKEKIIKLRNVSSGIDNYISDIENDGHDAEKKDSIWDALLEYYEKELGLPKRNFTNIESYKRECYLENKKFLANVGLTLRYSRNSYNEKLKEALCRAVILMQSDDINPCFTMCCFEKNSVFKSVVTEQYMNAMKYIYDNIVTTYIVGEEKPVEYIVKLENAMKNILDNINFCVVVTGREKDAYTLFEVLNDRNFPVEDLELIKNLFYKYYCKNSENNDNTDYFIEKADTKWGEIFSDTIGKEQSKLISYLAAQYFTADGRLKYNDNERYREAIEKQYLNRKQRYDGEALLSDICVYEMLEIILDEFDFKYQKKAENVIKAERENSKSITFKALNLFNALKLYGVIPAITNIILKKFLEKKPINRWTGGDYITAFRKYVQEIRDDRENNNTDFAEIHSVAYDFWRFALLAQNSDKPRNIAKDYISKNYVSNSDYSLKVTSQESDVLNEEFRRLINAWKYGNEISQLKVKVLFINLFNSTKEGNTLIFNKTGTNFKTDKIQLDHLEPDKTNAVASEKYFEPSSKLPRETYTDSLGNFMIMDAGSNNDKNTIPLQDALEIYDNMAGCHWLIKEIHDLFYENECGVDKNIDGKKYRIPNEEFFIRRKKRLICYFKAILTKKLGDNKVEFEQ